MKRRGCIVGLGIVVAMPRHLSAQREPKVLIGFLNSGTPDFIGSYGPAFRSGLADKGYVAGQNVTIEYRSAAGDYNRLAALAAELAKLNASIIVTFGLPAALAAKATVTVPVVFATGADPVGTGLVASLSKPGGTLTGVSLLSPAVTTKQIEVLHELLPRTEGVGIIINPKNRIYEGQLDQLRAAAQGSNLRLVVAQANTLQDVEEAYASLSRQQVGTVIVPGDPLLYSRLDQFVALQNRYHLPTVL